MKWELKEAQKGDVIRVKLGAIYHYGIFVSDDEVIQFGLPPAPDIRAEDVEVLSTPVETFIGDSFLEVGVPEKTEKRLYRGRDKTVEIARSRMGEKGYNILHNNCEHFVCECAFGMRLFDQSNTVREKIRSLPVADLYVYRFPFETEEGEIYPEERRAEIESVNNPSVKDQKYYVWKLLGIALARTFGMKMRNLKFKKANGKWSCNGCEFSLSHSGDIVAVAVSRKPVGVDAEKLAPERFSYGLIAKIANEKEIKQLAELPEDERGKEACKLWTVKEAAFKQLGGKSFSPKKTDSQTVQSVTLTVNSGDDAYLVSIVSPDVKHLNVRVNGVTVTPPIETKF